MSTDNPQYGNVGNRGDILKHAALVAAAGLLASRHPPDAVNYLDTHAFVLQVPLANGDWTCDLTWAPGAAAAYGAYRLLEGPYASRGDYLCSTGLVLATLGSARLHLSESHGPTRRLLERQLDQWQVVPAALLAGMEAWSEATPALRPGPLLALVDPFALDASAWRSAARAVARLWRPGDDGLLLVFNSSRDRTPPWPAPPPGWSGPIARIGDPPYFLAAYGAGPVAATARLALTALGWSV